MTYSIIFLYLALLTVLLLFVCFVLLAALKIYVATILLLLTSELFIEFQFIILQYVFLSIYLT